MFTSFHEANLPNNRKLTSPNKVNLFNLIKLPCNPTKLNMAKFIFSSRSQMTKVKISLHIQSCQHLHYLHIQSTVKAATQKEDQNFFQDQSSLNEGQRYCRMLPLEHSAILSTFIKQPLPFRPLFCLFMRGHL